MPIEPSASAPFTDGHWLLSHNGLVDRAVLPLSEKAESTCDSAVLAALIFERGLDALGDTIVEVADADPNARLNILAGNGSRLLATTWGDTLSTLRRDDGVVLASEPYDDNPDWQEVPDRHGLGSRPGHRTDPAERIVMTFALSNYLSADSAGQALRRDVRDGLTQTPKSLPPKWFYDSAGSDLFDQITRLPEYYPTRTEAQILRERSAEIVAASGADTLVELGSGTSEKTRMLLDALRDNGSLRRFIPFDVDASVLKAAGSAIEKEYPGIEIDAVCGDFEEHLGKIPGLAAGWSSSSDRRSETSRRARAPSSSPRWRRRCSPATACCWVPTWLRTPIDWCARMTTAQASLHSSTATCWPWSTVSWTRISTSTRSSTSRNGTPTRSASRCGCAPAAPSGCR